MERKIFDQQLADKETEISLTESAAFVSWPTPRHSSPTLPACISGAAEALLLRQAPQPLLLIWSNSSQGLWSSSTLSPVQFKFFLFTDSIWIVNKNVPERIIYTCPCRFPFTCLYPRTFRILNCLVRVTSNELFSVLILSFLYHF